MHILFITTGIYAVGETYIAVKFAQELLRDSIQCSFLAPPFGANYIWESLFSIRRSKCTMNSIAADIISSVKSRCGYTLFTSYLYFSLV